MDASVHRCAHAAGGGQPGKLTVKRVVLSRKCPLITSSLWTRPARDFYSILTVLLRQYAYANPQGVQRNSSRRPSSIRLKVTPREQF